MFQARRSESDRSVEQEMGRLLYDVISIPGEVAGPVRVQVNRQLAGIAELMFVICTTAELPLGGVGHAVAIAAGGRLIKIAGCGRGVSVGGAIHGAIAVDIGKASELRVEIGTGDAQRQVA